MPLLLPDGVTLMVEVALTSATGQAGIWDVSLWDSAIWGAGENWEDVSAYVRSVDTSRKFSRDLRSWSAGSATVVLNNVDGRFCPDNTTGPYTAGGITGIRPGRPMRISLIYAGITYWLFYGYAYSWAESWVAHGPRKGDALMTVSGKDEWGRLAKTDGYAVAPVGAGELFGQRISRVLDAAGMNAPRDIDLGSNTMQATDLSDAPLTELGVTAASEGGAVWIDADGTFLARRKYALVEDSRSTTVQATFGDGGGVEIPWVDIDVAPVTDDMIINVATYKRVGGTDQRYTDPTSIALYGDCDDKSPNRDNLVCETDAQTYSLAQWAVATNKDPEARINQLTIKPRCDPTVLMPLILGLKIRDLIEVIIRPPSATLHTMTRSCFVSGIAMKISDADMEVKIDTSAAGVYRAFSTSLWDLGLWDEALWLV